MELKISCGHRLDAESCYDVSRKQTAGSTAFPILSGLEMIVHETISQLNGECLTVSTGFGHDARAPSVERFGAVRKPPSAGDRCSSAQDQRAMKRPS
jgi:hypothetical protein